MKKIIWILTLWIRKYWRSQKVTFMFVLTLTYFLMDNFLSLFSFVIWYMSLWLCNKEDEYHIDASKMQNNFWCYQIVQFCNIGVLWFNVQNRKKSKERWLLLLQSWKSNDYVGSKRKVQFCYHNIEKNNLKVHQ